jgi:hypothetical protein
MPFSRRRRAGNAASLGVAAKIVANRAHAVNFFAALKSLLGFRRDLGDEF